MADEKIEVDYAGKALRRTARDPEYRSPLRFRDAIILSADDGTKVARSGPRFYAVTTEGLADWDRELSRDEVPASILASMERAGR